MKAIKQWVMVFALLLVTSAFALASKGVPEKYNLDNQLEKVPSISRYNFMGWEKVDNQSFVLQTSPDTYYLIVLSSPAERLPFGETVRIDTSDAMVRPGYNYVIVGGHGFSERYIINKIYKFKNADQVKEIVTQLTGKTR